MKQLEGIEIFDKERVDDLQFMGLRIIQGIDSFRFGTDSVLLAAFSRPHRGSSCIDLGAGSGVLSILIGARTGCNMTAVEIDGDQCSRIERSDRLNSGRITSEEKTAKDTVFDNNAPKRGDEKTGIRVINADYLTETARIGIGKYDCAVCNPPYFRCDCGKVSARANATHELSADINGVARAASCLIKFGGKLFMCYPTQRLAEALCALVGARLEPKKLRLVATKQDSPPYLALIEAKKGAKSGLIIEKNLVLHREDGSYTDEVREIYHER